MDKKSISLLRREFKLDSFAFKIDQIYSVYFKKDSGNVITKSLRKFNALDTERQQLYMDNFRKILTNSIDIKSFELEISDKNFKHCLEVGIDKSESLESIGDNVVRRVAENFNYDTDIVFNFLKASYYKNIKKKKSSSEEYIQNIEFILCSVNRVDIPQKALILAYPEMEFKTNSCLGVNINLRSPLDGFVYPSFGVDYADTDKLIYYSHKANNMNNTFVEDVLGCERNFTASEENHIFKSILRDSTENKICPGKMKNIYDQINHVMSENDDGEYEFDISMKELADILSENGLDRDNVKNAIKNASCGEKTHFKIHNLIENFLNKPMKIENSSLSLAIDGSFLDCVKVQRNKNGQKCLVITLLEDVSLDGINIKTEKQPIF